MSIYSGFATRQQEQAYDQNIATLLYLMQKRIYKFYQNQPANEGKFIDLLLKIYLTVKNMEESKYLEPKLSTPMAELIEFLKTKREQMTVVSESKDVKNQQSDSKQSKPSTKKPALQSSIQLQTNNKVQKKQSQKINFTERVAQNSQSKIQSLSKNNLIRKRVSSNVHHKSVLIATNSQTQLDIPIVEMSKPIVFNTPKSKQLEAKKEKTIDKTENQHQSKRQTKEQKKMQREDVRELIKGYLVKRKKYYGKEHEFRRQQINQIFKDI